MEVISHFTAYVRIVILSLVALNGIFFVSPTYIVYDRTHSKFCSSGLLASKDTIHLEIRINVTTETDTKSASFKLWSKSETDEVKIKLCEVLYSSPCYESSTEECYCRFNQENQYTFVFKTTAEVSHKDSDVFVNDEQTPALRLPHVYGVEKAIMSMNITGHWVQLHSYCQVSAAPGSTVLFTFCAYHLNAPSLQVSYGGFEERLESRLCIRVAFCVHDNTKPIELTYVDKCGRMKTSSCIVKATYESETTLIPEVNITEINHRFITEHISYNWIQIFLITCGLVVLSFAFALIYMKMKDSCSSGAYGDSISKSDGAPSSPVDALHPSAKPSQKTLSRISMKRSLSQLTFHKDKDDTKPNGLESPAASSVDPPKTSLFGRISMKFSSAQFKKEKHIEETSINSTSVN